MPNLCYRAVRCGPSWSDGEPLGLDETDLGFDGKVVGKVGIGWWIITAVLDVITFNCPVLGGKNEVDMLTLWPFRPFEFMPSDRSTTCLQAICVLGPFFKDLHTAFAVFGIEVSRDYAGTRILISLAH